jgi:hypothetical protein
MYEIWRLKRLTIKRRAKQGLPPIEDPNDLPDPRQQEEYVSVLNEKEQQQLDTHQQAFAKSQTWYKPHATATHKAYPISYALANTFVSTNVYSPLPTSNRSADFRLAHGGQLCLPVYSLWMYVGLE